MKSEQASGGKGPPSSLAMAFSTITHLLLAAPVVYVIVLACIQYSFFSWHPICMSLGAGLLVTEAVFAISGESYVSHKLSRKSRVTVHWVLHGFGVALLLCGLIVIVVNKNNHGKEHFATTHGQLGLSTIVLTAAVACFGVLANNPKWLYPRVRPVLMKVVHALAGICITVLLLATIINGTYRHWWPESHKVGRDLVFASLFFGGLFVLAKPILGAISRSRVILKPPSSGNSAGNT